VGDVRATIEALLPRLKEKRDSSHLEEAREHYRKARKGLDELAVFLPGRESCLRGRRGHTSVSTMGFGHMSRRGIRPVRAVLPMPVLRLCECARS